MSKKIKTGFFIAIAIFLAWIGISKSGKFAQEYSLQQQALGQVQKLVNETENINDISDFNSLKFTRDSLQKTITTIEEIPNFPGIPYQKAQKDLAELRPRLANVESKLKIEEQALANLESALKLDKEAANIVKEQTYSQTTWKESKDKWAQAINLLENIPANTFVSDAATKGLVACKRNFSDVSQVIESEENALQDLNSAIKIAQKANEITTKTPYTLPDLLTAKSQWQSAINLVNNLPTNTIASRNFKSELIEYRKNYRIVSDAIDQIKNCMADNSTFESLCTDNTSLNITAPTTLTALDDNDEFESSINSRITTPNYSTTGGSSDVGGFSSGGSSGVSGFSSGTSIYVQPYTRSDGTRVRGHYRSSPKTRVGGFGRSRSGGSSS
ncbi:tetratricopeptide repeat protein [Nodularia sphaerocarpa]|uniref:tetratricopeptide repeat protein n=1 Tax=Nodularia sphaerocarpa TaxID=137816 RepID=UPI00232C9EFF|nr:hypothetical protein [Nodularia sphaerocarpa]MDB9372330.1 hypothetical protein [Nodularia sphaerocarpa CS-585]MDB9377946.1 hypothetical protein [Nodularia sphaerocarpa CS-585A2]